jgi:hypothetical protein
VFLSKTTGKAPTYSFLINLKKNIYIHKASREKGEETLKTTQPIRKKNLG